MRSRFFWVTVSLGCLTAALRADPPLAVSVVDADGCPIRIESADVEPGVAGALRLRYTVYNPQGRTADRLVITAATVDRDGAVTTVRFQSVDGTIEGRTRATVRSSASG